MDAPHRRVAIAGQAEGGDPDGSADGAEGARAPSGYSSLVRRALAECVQVALVGSEVRLTNYESPPT